MWPAVVILAQLNQAQLSTVKAAYHRLDSQAIESHQAKQKPPKDVERVDVSERIRSASFGHTTTLLVPPGGHEFWVEYGKSTNRPGGLYGPFPVAVK